MIRLYLRLLTSVISVSRGWLSLRLQLLHPALPASEPCSQRHSRASHSLYLQANFGSSYLVLHFFSPAAESNETELTSMVVSWGAVGAEPPLLLLPVNLFLPGVFFHPSICSFPFIPMHSLGSSCLEHCGLIAERGLAQQVSRYRE